MNRKGQVLITGASGFVGSAVARKLVEAGFSVRALVRPNSPRFHLRTLELEYTIGDLRDPRSLRPAMAGAQYLFHVAADYRLWSRDRDEIYRNNVTGTRAIMEAALEAGVARVVYTSSVATLALTAGGPPSDESKPLDETQAIGVYKRSKVAAERLVEQMIDRGLPAVIVNPSTPIGPCDVKPTPTGRVIVEAARGHMPGYVDTGLNLVHVDDVAAGHLAALERGKIGERYILGGQDVLLSEMLADIARLTGRRPPRLKMPRRALYPFAWVAEATARITGREPFVTLDALKMAKYHMFFDPTKAERELGVKARPYIDALKDAIAWFEDAGYLTR